MSAVLNWSRFDNGSVAPERAFEAFSAQLFERWLRREHPNRVSSYTLHGAGGDGGVEAFARLTSGEVVGLQAKWFAGNIYSDEIEKVRSSLDRAVRTFPSLKRYIVTLRQNLTKARNKKEMGGVERWEQFIKDVAVDHPAVEIIRWDEAGLVEQLTKPGNQEVKALWFEGELTFATLVSAWARTRARLNDRYVPDLHSVGCIEATLAADLWTGSWRKGARARLDEGCQRLTSAAEGLSHFAWLTHGHRPPDLDGALTQARAEVEVLQDHARRLSVALDTGPWPTPTSWPPGPGTDLLMHLLEEHKRQGGWHAGEQAIRAARAFEQAKASLRSLDEEMRGGSAPRLFAGPAGCGKTHAAAAFVDRAVAASAPAVMILASGCDPKAGAARLLGDALDLPGWPLRRILDALEALATLQHLREAGEGTNGFCRCPVIIDGLEEATGSGAWADLLADLTAERTSRPRVHLVATTRPEFLRRIALPIGVQATPIPEDAGTKLPAMLRAYAKRFDVALDQVPWLGWALRSPLEVRLLAEEFRGRAVSAADGAHANLLTLFHHKLVRLEAEALRRAGSLAWSEGVGLLHAVLRIIAKATGDGLSDLVADQQVIERAGREDPEFSAQRVRFALSILVEHGLVDVWKPPSRSLRIPKPEYRLTTRHLSDFILATDLAEGVLNFIRAGQRPHFPEVLDWREHAAALFAARLAEEGHFVMDVDWEVGPDDVFELHADALAWLSPERAGTRAAEVAAWLTETTARNRALLRRVVLPVARIPGHPLGPRLLDEALRALTLPDREMVWSVPEGLDGIGPWADCDDDILDEVRLDPAVDEWDGMPLVAAWMLSSVVEARRTRARELLAVWGASRLVEMVKLVRRMAVVDDPQVVDDLLVAALGAAIGARLPDDALLDLARLVDTLFFAKEASAWTPSVQVRVAARGIVERANLACPGVIPELVARATPPYRPRGADWPGLDLDEARTAISHFGGRLVRYPAHPYVAKCAAREFFVEGGSADNHVQEFPDCRLLAAIDDGTLVAPPKLARARKLRAAREAPLLPEYADHDERTDRPRYSAELTALLKHAERAAGCAVNLAQVRNGMIAHWVRTWGWSEERFSLHDWSGPARVVDDAIASQHGSGPDHGTRSAVAQFREKYIFAAVDRVAGDLADRLPVWSRDSGAWVHLTNMDGLGNGLPDPLPATMMEGVEDTEAPAAWEPPGILPEQFVHESDLARRAERWVTEGALPDPRRTVTGAIGEWPMAAVLGLRHYRRGHQGCVDQLMEVRAFGVRAVDLDLLRRDAPFTATKLYDHGAWVEEGVYLSPALACWAPWLTWCGEDQGYDSFDGNGDLRRVELRSAVGTGTARFEGDHPQEPTVWMPAPALARALGVVTFDGDSWCRRYVDRSGACIALERDVQSDSYAFVHNYLAMDLERYVSHLAASEMVPVWIVRMWLEANPALFRGGMSELDVREGLDHHSREVVWLVIGDPAAGPQETMEIRCTLEAWTHRKSERSRRRPEQAEQGGTLEERVEERVEDADEGDEDHDGCDEDDDEGDEDDDAISL